MVSDTVLAGDNALCGSFPARRPLISRAITGDVREASCINLRGPMASTPNFTAEARIIVRTAQRADIDELAQVDVRAWRAAYADIFPPHTLDGLSVRRALIKWSWVVARRRARDLVLVAEVDGRIAGFCQAGPARDDSATVAEIYTIYVDPHAWRRGVGSALMEVALSWLAPRYERAVLWVVRENAPARRFYEAHGFEWVQDSFRVFPFVDYFAQCVRYETGLNAHLSFDWQTAFGAD